MKILDIQNRIWTLDKSEALGWPNSRICLLCQQATETMPHVFKDCSRFTRRLWAEIMTSTSNNMLHLTTWSPRRSIESWWTAMSSIQRVSKRGLLSLIILVTWEVLKERNNRIFEQTKTTNYRVLQNIKDETGCLDHNRNKTPFMFPLAWLIEFFTSVLSSRVLLLFCFVARLWL